jgi:hypothetical protein
MELTAIIEVVKGFGGALSRCLAAKRQPDSKSQPTTSTSATTGQGGITIINGSGNVTINVNYICNATDIQKFDAQVLQFSSPVIVYESLLAIEPQRFWLCWMNQNEQYIACGAYFSCEHGGKIIRFWLGLIFSENEPKTGLYVRIPASEVAEHSESKSVCGIKSYGNEYRIPIAYFSAEPNERDMQKWFITLEEKAGELLRDSGAL